MAQLDLALQDVVDLAARVQAADRPCGLTLRLACERCGHRAQQWVGCPDRCERCTARGDARARALRRMLPRDAPLRHWVLTLPEGHRQVPAPSDREVAALVKAFVDGIFGVYRRSGPPGPDAEIHCGAAVVVHRLGAALDRNLHVHVVALDGGYRIGEDEVVFHRRGAGPTAAELGAIIAGVSAVLPAGSAPAAVVTQARGDLEPARRLRISPPERPARPPPSREPDPPSADPSARSSAAGGRAQPSKAAVNGVAVYAASAVEPTDRARVSRLAAYVVRPEVKPDAFEPGPAGRVRYRLHRPAPDGSTHVELPASAALARLSPLSRPCASGRTSYHGVLAPAAVERWRVMQTQLRLAPDLLGPRPRGRRRTADPGRSRVDRDPARGPPLRCPSCGAALRIVSVHDCNGAARPP